MGIELASNNGEPTSIQRPPLEFYRPGPDPRDWGAIWDEVCEDEYRAARGSRFVDGLIEALPYLLVLVGAFAVGFMFGVAEGTYNAVDVMFPLWSK